MLVNQLPRAMRRARFFPNFCLTTALVGGSFLFGGGCGGHAHEAPAVTGSASPAPSATPPIVRRIVGEIAVVNAAEHFVLIDLGSNLYVPAPGTTLRSLDAAGVAARLKTSPEQKRPFIAADIIDGTPKVGDEVLR